MGATAADLNRDEAKILAHYAAGETLDEIAVSAGTGKDEVVRVVGEIAAHNRAYAKTLTLEWQRNHSGRNGSAPKLTPVVVPKQVNNDVIADLLNRAIGTDVPRLVRLADKVQDLIDQLEEQLTEHEQGQALRAEAAQLEQRLASIKQQLNPKRTAAAAAAPAVTDSKTVRAWAKASGVDCPTHGRVPASVLAAYARRVGNEAQETA